MTPGSASKVTVAAWPTLSLVTSASVKLPTIWSLPVSASSMKPLDPPVRYRWNHRTPLCDRRPGRPAGAGRLADEPDDALRSRPTAPLTAVTVPANGALSTVPATVRWASR